MKNIKKDIIYKKIGRVVFFKYSLWTLLLLLFLPIIILSPYYFFSSEPGSGVTYVKKLFNDISENLPFLIIQVLFIFLCIWFFSDIPVRQIIENHRNKFWTSFFSLFILWIILFISCEFTSGIIHSITYGVIKGFEAAVFDWFFFKLIVWLIFTIVCSFIASPFMGREIKRRANKANLRLNV